ncbi:MAG: T9SS type A sorting domain-containing protein [Bacteroidales bacterium]|nr:T9SS type A sorting domain-containing protein [Bacteroidales bacterium]
MKKRTGLFFLLVFSMNGLHSQGYQKLVETGNRWNYVYGFPMILGLEEDGNYEVTYSFFLTNDTTIVDTKYVKLMCDVITFDKTETNYFGALREDTINQRVFFLNPANEERLAYSFNHAVGDTIMVDSTSVHDGYFIRSVKAIDTVEYGGVQRKKMEVCNTVYLHGVGTPYDVFTDHWIEGIGSLKQLLANIIYPYLSDIYKSTLLCFWHEGEQIYSNPVYDLCVYTSEPYNIENINSHEDIILYPNPVSGLLHVSCNEPIRKIELLDMEGSLLQATSTNELDVSKLADDIYFIRATTVSARMLIERFIKRTQ